MDAIDGLACAAFDLQYRVQNCQILYTCIDLTNLLIVKESYPTNPQLIALGFGLSAHYDQVKQVKELRARVLAVYEHPTLGVRPEEPWVWRKYDQQKLSYQLRTNIVESPTTYKHWFAFEREREPRRLPYLVIQY